MTQVKKVKVHPSGYAVVFGRNYYLRNLYMNHAGVYAAKIDGDIKIVGAEGLKDAKEKLGLTRPKNPSPKSVVGATILSLKRTATGAIKELKLRLKPTKKRKR